MLLFSDFHLKGKESDDDHQHRDPHPPITSSSSANQNVTTSIPHGRTLTFTGRYLFLKINLSSIATELKTGQSSGAVCECRGGRPRLHVPDKPYGLCGRKASLNSVLVRAQELCESRSGRPGLHVPDKPYGLCGR